ncbi:hypothetical protein [Nocardioides sp. AE5]|uniref:hypothetical protein n=1 Tax=Nocardioides sp. AE5 TaxID=2962573 RepID=UPI002881F429|nr:hypothetical protein [Nocardioides sp. AE5]MDT0202156.1 hypothetical protein [Nocardioides sp. AE5]
MSEDWNYKDTGAKDWNFWVEGDFDSGKTRDRIAASQPELLDPIIDVMNGINTFASSDIGPRVQSLMDRLEEAWSGNEASEEAMTKLTQAKTDAGTLADDAAKIASELETFRTKWYGIKDQATGLSDGWDVGPVTLGYEFNPGVILNPGAGVTVDGNQDDAAKALMAQWQEDYQGAINQMPGRVEWHDFDGQMATPYTPTPGGVPGPGTGFPGPGAPGPGVGMPGPGTPGPGFGEPGPGNPGPGTPGPGFGTPGPGTPGPGMPGPGTGLETDSQLAGIGPGGGGTGLSTGGPGGAGLGGGGLGGGGLSGGGGVGAGGVGGGPAGGGLGAGGAGAGSGGGLAAAGRGGMGPGMMPGRAGNEEGQEQERSTWLAEDEDVWGGEDVPPDLT